MEQRKRTMKKGATKVTAIALAIAAVMALALCGCASQGDTSKSDIPAEDRTNAKQVLMAAGDLFTMMDLGLTDADSPATISKTKRLPTSMCRMPRSSPTSPLSRLPQHARTALRRTTATP